MIYHLFQSGAAFSLTDERGETIADDTPQDELLEIIERLVASDRAYGQVFRLSNHAIVECFGALPGEILFLHPDELSLEAALELYAAVPF